MLHRILVDHIERTGGMHDLASVTPGNVMSPEEVNKILQGIRRTEFNILGKENDGVKTAVIQQTDDPVPGSAVIETFAADAENIPSAIPRKNAGHVSGRAVYDELQVRNECLSINSVQNALPTVVAVGIQRWNYERSFHYCIAVPRTGRTRPIRILTSDMELIPKAASSSAKVFFWKASSI